MPAIGLLPALALLAGVGCGALMEWDGTMFLWALPVAWAAGCLAWLLVRRSHPQSPECVIGPIVLGFFCAGAALAADARDASLHTPLRSLLDESFGDYAIESLGPGGPHDPLALRAVLLEDASSQNGVTTLRVHARHVAIRGAWRDTQGGVTLSISGALAQQHAREWRAGRAIQAPVTFRRPTRYLNDGVADFEHDLALDGTTLFGSVKSGLLVDVRARGNVIQEVAAEIRGHVRESVARWVTPYDTVSGAIVTAVLIGDRTGLPQDVRLRMQAAGTYHVIAISGGNIAILAGLTLLILMCCGIRGRPAAAMTLAVLVAYAQIATGGASVWRATLMAALYLAARLLDHRSAPWHAVGIAATLILCARPLEARDVGFLLTFGATAALLETARRMARVTAMSPLSRWMLGAVAASVAAEIALLPVSAWTFSRVTGAGIALNLVAVPMMGIVQIAGLIVASLDAVHLIAAPAGWVGHIAAATIVESARTVDMLPWLIARVPPPSVLVVVTYYAGLLSALFGRGVFRICALVTTGTAALFIVTGLQPSVAARAVTARGIDVTGLRVTAFDVGQGDATLVELSDGRRMLVDAGGVPFGTSTFDIGARVLAPALWARGVRDLDTLLITHGDPDHVGGALSVASDFFPNELWEGISPPGHVVMRELRNRLSAAGGRTLERRAGEDLNAGEATIRVLHPRAPDWERRQVRNDDSIVIEIVYGDVALLLPGDISAAIERQIAPLLTPARVRILKVAHHGSRTSTSRELLEQWRPTIAIISCGRGNTFGHPAPEVISRLESIGAAIYRTDVDGQITVTTDGRDVQIRTYLGGPS